MALIGFAVTISIPILLILKSILIDKTKIDYHEWIMTVSMLVNVVLPIMSGFFITQSMQKNMGKNHYQYCYCTSKQKNFCIEQNCGVVLLVLRRYDGYRVFDNRWFIDVVPYTSYTSDDLFYNTVIHTNWFLSYIASLPIIWIAIRQRTLFYPSMLCTLVFVLLQSIGAQVSEELLPVASFVPWLAIQISTMLPQNSQYLYICIASVLCAGIVGIGLSLHEFNKQDL